jgi:O-antigen ligase
MTYFFTSITCAAIYVLLIFAPLARGSVHGWAVNLIHMITLIGVTAFLLEKNRVWDWKWIKTPLDKPIAALMLLVFLSTALSMHWPSSARSVILLTNYLAIYYLIVHTVDTRDRLRRLVWLMVGMGLFLSIFGLFKRFGVNPFPWWDYNELKYTPDFLASTYGNHNHLAGYLEMAILMVLALFLTEYEKGRFFLMVYVTLLMVLALVLSLSRGGWIGFFLGLMFMAAALWRDQRFKNKKVLLAGAGLCLISAIIVLISTPVVERVRTVIEKDQAANLQSRLIAWAGTVEMIKDRPILGTGPGTYATLFPWYQPPGIAAQFDMAHNDYLQVTAETGVFLIPMIIWMIVALFRKGFKKMKNPSRLVRATTLGAMSGIVAILCHSISDFNLHIPANALLFTVLAAVVAAPLPRHRRQQQPHAS